MSAQAKKPAVILLSGGLDSATVLALAQEAGYDVHCLSFSYGQRHGAELGAARLLAQRADVADHRIAQIDLRLFGGSALTDARLAVPKSRSTQEMGTGIPITYVPARNTIFLSFALGFAETIGAFDIFIGVNAVDYSGYPDCRPEYIEAFEKTANLALAACVEGKGSMTLHTPLLRLSKAEIIRQGTRLGVDFGHTVSCYDPDEEGRACGQCDACQLRKKGFSEAGLSDPTRYFSL